MTVREQLALAPIQFPPEITDLGRRQLLAPLKHSAVWADTRHGAEWRRGLTRDQPLYFAILYLSHRLQDEDTGLHSLSTMHMQLAHRGRRWASRGERIREGLIAPRKAAKSTWLFTILPLWALAHGHRRFLMAFSKTDPTAAKHLNNLRWDLANNELLRADFPELIPVRKGAHEVECAGGGYVAARGMGATIVGVRSPKGGRPDILVGDDLEPTEQAYSPTVKQDTLTALRQGILPLNDRAVVQLTGTVTAPGSLAHDMALAGRGRPAAPWISEEGFTCRYVPPIYDEGTARERSCWPQQWTLEYLKAQQGTRTYALNMANDPDLAEATGYWRRELFRYDAQMTAAERILYVDPAVTNNKDSDKTGVVVLGINRRSGRVIVEHAEAVTYLAEELRDYCRDVSKLFPKSLKLWRVEQNQGCQLHERVMSPRPTGVEFELEPVRGSKKFRLREALGHYQRGAVYHRPHLKDGALEQQAMAWTPRADVDDLLDALAGGLRWAFPGSVEGAA